MTVTFIVRYFIGGVLYVFFTFMYFGLLLEPKYKKYPLWVYALFNTLIIQPLCIGRVLIENVVGFLLLGWVQLVILAGSIIIVFKNKIWEKILVLLFWMIASTVSESILRIGMGIQVAALEATEPDPIILVHEILLYIFIFVILGCISVAWKTVRTKHVPKNIWVFLLFPLSQYLTVMSLTVDHLFGIVAYPYPWRIVFSLLIGVIADVILFYVMFTQGEKEEIRQRLAETEKLMEMEKGYYETIEARREEMAKIRHDFGNQLTAALHIAQNGEQEKSVELLEQLKEEIEKNSERKWCDNSVLNAVLTEKCRMCARAGVTFTAEVEASENMGIQPLHLCSVMANLLDNAIHAAEECGAEEAFVSVHAKQQERYFFIKVENTSKEPVQREKRPGHGYGLQIVKNIAETYNGEYKGNWKNSVYTAVVVLEQQ